MIRRRSLLLASASPGMAPLALPTIGIPGTALAQARPPGAPPGVRAPLPAPGRRSVLQRVLLRPGATVHATPGAAESRPGLGFTAFYVYRRQGGPPGSAEEWLEIGAATDGRTEGWVRGDRALEWSHGMVAAFTNPAARGRTLFMAEEAEARALIAPGGAGLAGRLRAEALAGRPAAGVLALEPERYVDITRQFYLLPILRAEVVDRETGGPVRVLEVVSVPAERDPAPRQPPPDALARFRAGLVFVVDTTVSMQPYIDRTREAMEGVVERLRQTAVRDNFRFGTVAFRDSQAAQPQGFEYVTRIHGLPDFGQPPEAALAAMRGVAATTVNNEGFDEDPVAGLLEALERVDWTPLGGRYVVLITDAGACDAADELSSTRLGLEQVRERAAQKGVTVFVIHLLTREGRLAGNHSRARRQYLSLTQGPAGELYYPVEDGAEEQFRATVSMLVEGLLRQVAETTGRPVAELRTRPATTPPSAERQRQAERMEQQLRVVGEAMRLAYLGREERTRAPDVVRSFVLDRDPAPPGNLGIEVRVMLTRNQLSDLTRTLEEILRAGRADRLDETAFFQQLQTALALAARDPTRIAQAGALGGLLGEFLEGLPYTSQIMGLTDREWRAMGASGQARLLNEIETKLRFYRYFSNDANLWRSLSGRPDAGEEVFPVPLSALP